MQPHYHQVHIGQRAHVSIGCAVKLSMTKADSTLIIEVNHEKELLSAMCINHM